MPRYNKKITRLMDYEEFKAAIEGLPVARQAFLSILFFTGCRVSEALALTSDDISCTKDMIYIQFHRLKGSKQTDPTEIPKADALLWLCEQECALFNFSRTTANRIIQRVWPDLSPNCVDCEKEIGVLEHAKR